MIRIDRANRNHAELLDPENWMSSAWGGDTLRDCKGCTDCDPDNPAEKLWQCYGERQVEDTRHGISVCADLDDLIDYLAAVGGTDLDDAVLVELTGDYSDDEGHDAHLGEHLILPTEIVSITPLTEDIAARILAKIDEDA